MLPLPPEQLMSADFSPAPTEFASIEAVVTDLPLLAGAPAI